MPKQAFYHKLFFISCVFSLAGCNSDSNKSTTSNVKLIDWSHGECDHSFDAYRMVDRVTSFNMKGDTAYINISFGANCCEKFKPYIFWDANGLHLFPYKHATNRPCDCDCCFSLNFTISGIPKKKFDIYFGKTKIPISKDPYPVQKETFYLKDGDTLNRTNKYGARVGLWKSWFASGKINSIQVFPKQCAYPESSEIRRISYFENGSTEEIYSQDTFMRWNAKGILIHSDIEEALPNGDTKETELDFYDNGNKKEIYISIDIAEKNRKENANGSVTTSQTIIREEYFENGKPKYIMGDPSKSWYESGKIKFIAFDDTSTTFNEQGKVIEQESDWEVYNKKIDYHLRYFIIKKYHPNGKIASLELGRDEPDNDGSISMTVRYDWEWNTLGELTKQPDDWKGQLPLWRGVVK